MSIRRKNRNCGRLICRSSSATSSGWKIADEANEVVSAYEAEPSDFDGRKLVRAQQLVNKTAADAELLPCALNRHQQRQLVIGNGIFFEGFAPIVKLRINS